METSTDAPVRDAVKPNSEVWRRLWLSWWDGIWLWIGFTIALAIALLPVYLLHLVVPEPVSRVAGGVLIMLVIPVVVSRVFRVMDNTKPWEKKRP